MKTTKMKAEKSLGSPQLNEMKNDREGEKKEKRDAKLNEGRWRKEKWECCSYEQKSQLCGFMSPASEVRGNLMEIQKRVRLFGSFAVELIKMN